MKHPSFLARTTLGQPNYLLVAMAAAFVIALAPYGAYKAVISSSNRIDQWLPAARACVQDAHWFRTQFGGDQFVLVSWDGCTLADAAKLQRLATKLTSSDAAAGREKLLSRVATGPQMLAQLTAPPLSAPNDAAIRRLEGSVIGPAASAGRGQGGGESARATCLVAYLSPEAIEHEALGREAIERIRELAATEARLAPAAIRIVGPGVEAPTIGMESRRTLVRLGALGGLLGMAVCYWRLGSLKLAAAVTGVGLASAAMSLAMIYYGGLLEVFQLGRVRPQWGVADALTLATPMVVFVLAISAALRLVYYYRDARLDHGVHGAAERAVAEGWPAWLLTALLASATLGVFCLSNLAPAQRLALFTGLGVIASVGFVLAILPVVLHRFPPGEALVRRISGKRGDGAPPRWLNGIFELGMASRAAALVGGVGLFGLASWGLMRLEVSPQIPALVAARSDLMKDTTWFGQQIGQAVPLEVVLTVPLEHCREPNEGAEEDGQQYRLTMLERMELMWQVQRRVQELPTVSGVLSAATLMPAEVEAGGVVEALRESLEDLALVRTERHAASDRPMGRELWLASARVTASMPGKDSIDYGEINEQMHAAVEPVLLAYRQRDAVVQNLHERAERLQGAKVIVLFRAKGDAESPPQGSQERLLGNLLSRSGAAEVTYLNLAAMEKTGRAADAQRERAISTLRERQAAVLVSASSDPAAGQLSAQGVNLIDVTDLPEFEGSAATPLVEFGGPRPIRAVYAGAVPVALAASRELTATLRESALVATPLLALAMMFVAWNPVAGLASMIPILFPSVMALGLLGWAGAAIDVGVLLAASLALGVALDGTIHFLAWFRRAALAGLSRSEAARLAFARCAPGMLDTALVGGVTLSALALSGIASAQQLGMLGVVVLGAAMAGTLVLLPAMAAGPLGRFFGAAAEPEETAAGSAVRRSVPTAREGETRPGRADAAAATAPPPHRARPTIPTTTADDRHEAADGPHAALQARLQRLRRSTGDSRSS